MSDAPQKPFNIDSNIVLVPCYKRPEYTKLCIESIENAQEYGRDTLFYLIDDGSEDGTKEILENCKLPWKHVLVNNQTCGLRNVILQFFMIAEFYKYMVKVDNDCIVPKNWLNDITHALDTLPVDILSPNVLPSNAAFELGQDDTQNLGYRPSKHVGGLWAMRASLVKGIYFEPTTTRGIKGAFHILNQIITEKEPRIGWLPSVTFEDIGHWSGKHPLHIKNENHQAYSVEVGRKIAWSAE